MNSEAGSLLVEGGKISEDQLQIALASVIQYGGNLVQNIVRLRLMADDELAAFLADRLKMPMAEGGQFENLPAFITRMISADLVLAHRAVPIMLHKGVLHVAMADPTDRAGLEEIAFATGYQVSPVVVAYGLIENAMARYYAIPPEDDELPYPESVAPLNGAAEPEPQPEDTRQDQPSDAFESGPWAAPAVPREPEEPERQIAPAQPAEPPAAAKHLQVVDQGASDLDELFFGHHSDDGEVIHLTKVKSSGSPAAGTIADAVLGQASDNGVEREPEPNREDVIRPAGPPIEVLTSTAGQAESKPAVAADTGQPAVQDAPVVAMTPITSAEEARDIISRAKDRDEVARGLVRFALAYLPRVALFIVKKDILVGWMGGGRGIYQNLVKGIMIPLNSPSVFRTVRETATDYFGSLPRTTVNDIFVSALGDVRPRRVLLVPISVRHKPICILYGDCASEPGFSKDLSPIHLLVGDVSNGFERIILSKKIGRLVVR